MLESFAADIGTGLSRFAIFAAGILFGIAITSLYIRRTDRKRIAEQVNNETTRIQDENEYLRRENKRVCDQRDELLGCLRTVQMWGYKIIDWVGALGVVTDPKSVVFPRRINKGEISFDTFDRKRSGR
jgi:hypothetical protein